MALSRRKFLQAAGALAGSLILPQLSFGYSAQAHTSLTKQAVRLHKNSSHHPDFDQEDLVAQLIKGSVDEDIPVTNCAEHYYNPDRPAGQNGLIFPAGFKKESLIQAPEQLKHLENLLATSVVNDGSKNALNRAQRLWEKSLELYRAGQLPEAYHTLGRVCHLLEDMASPEHVYLVDHAIVKIVARDGSVLNSEILQKFGLHLKAKDIDPARSTYQIGSTYEKQCEKIDLEKLLQGQRLEAVEKNSLKELFDGMARESFDSPVSSLIQKHLQLGQEGNGSYLNAQFELDETETIYRHLAPQAVGRLAGLLKSWEREIKGPAKKNSVNDFSEGFLFIGLDHKTQKNGLYKLSLDGKNLTKLLDSNSPDSFSFDFDVRRNLLVAELDGKIVTMNLDGGDKKIIFSKFPACRPQITDQGIIIKKLPLENMDGLQGWFRLDYYKLDDAQPIFSSAQPFNLYCSSPRGANMYSWANNKEPHERRDCLPIPRFSPDGKKMALVLPEISSRQIDFERYIFMILGVENNFGSWSIQQLGDRLKEDISKTWQEHGLEPSRKERATAEEIVWAPDSSLVFFDQYVLKAGKFLASVGTNGPPKVFDCVKGDLMEYQKPQKITYPLSHNSYYKCADISQEKKLVISSFSDFLVFANLNNHSVEKVEYQHPNAFEGKERICHSPAFFPDGKKVAFVHYGFHFDKRMRDKEGNTDVLVIYDLESKKSQEVDLFPLCGITTPRPVIKL